MQEDTRTLAERYEAMKAERDELEQKVFTLALLLSHSDHHEYRICAVNECHTVPDWKSTRLPLCRTHLLQAACDYQGREDDFSVEDYPSEFHQLLAQRIAKHAARKQQTPAVYYIQMNNFIKIGTTTNLKQRMLSFYAQPQDLLAIEPGGREREVQRHEEFKALRQNQTELFSLSPDLLAHITSVRRVFGDPARFLEPVIS